MKSKTNLPEWLRRHLPSDSSYRTRELVKDLGLNTVCSEAKCPNLAECYSKQIATFMILGRVCTRSCKFCSVETGLALEPDLDEPHRVAEAARRLGLSHVVVTSVTRDDLPDGGAEQFARTIHAVREMIPQATLEVLTPDFNESQFSLKTVCEARPDVFNHNIETVRRLTPEVRSRADYERSLKILKWVSDRYPDIKVKSGIMLGLGEREEEVLETLRDLRASGVQMVTIGQYLKPAQKCLDVVQYISPEQFSVLEEKAREMGFKEAASGPFVRSSYHARELFQKAVFPGINSR